MKIWLVALALAFGVGCHDAAKDLEGFAKRCTACKDKACAEQVVDDFVSYAKANPNPRGNEQNAAAQFSALTKCAIDKGVDLDTLLSKTKSL